MRIGRTLLLILTLSAHAQSPPQIPEASQDLQTAYCPQTHQLEVTPSQKFFLEGTIGKRNVRMYLDRGGSGVVGLFFDIDGNWQITQFGGTWNNRQIDASSDNEDHHATGHLKASLVDNHLNGKWTGPNGNDPEPVKLALIAEPPCDSKAPWKRFDEPNSPASFAYPALWHLEQDSDGIWLTCPDPSEIAYNLGVTIRMGLGAYKGAPELSQCRDKWLLGSHCDCDHPEKFSCQFANATKHGPATVLDVGDHEWRVYCRDGGYVGQGFGEDRIILLGHSWVEIIAEGKSSELIDRLVDSIVERR